MSFQAIRKIRQAKQHSPNLHNYEIPVNKNIQFNLDFNINNINGSDNNQPSKPIRQLNKTKDTDFKGQSSKGPSRKSSLGITSSKEKQRRLPLMGNFMHINIQGLKTISRRSSMRNDSQQYPKTQRMAITKYNTEMLQSKNLKQSNDQLKPISLSSFQRIFAVGKGGFGKVWKVSQKKTGKIYAMKEMLKAKIISKKSVSSVMNQKRLLQKLKHPLLVNMIYAFQNKQTLYLIMDYCNRGDLRYHIGCKGKFKQDQSRFFVACIVVTLEYIHKKGVIHRDLKPQNLVFDEKGYLKLTDLGVSRQVRPNNSEDTSGTPGYMAPQVICKMNHSYPVDFFALGVMAYQFMTGKRPYVGANRKQIRQKILAKQVQLDQIPPFGYSRQSVDFVNRLIIRKPQQRLGFNGIQEIKNHPWLKKIDWDLIQNQKLKSPFLPYTIQEDYTNYKECISQDTQIDQQEYQMILRHPDAIKAFTGYQFNLRSVAQKKNSQRKQLQSFMHTSTLLSRKKKN